MVLLWAWPQGSACYKGKRTRPPKAINGSEELQATVASDAVPLMAAQTGKRRRSLSPTHDAESTRAQETKRPRSPTDGPPDERGRARVDYAVSPR
jgi:hypothetical protein